MAIINDGSSSVIHGAVLAAASASGGCLPGAFGHVRDVRDVRATSGAFAALTDAGGAAAAGPCAPSEAVARQ